MDKKMTIAEKLHSHKIRKPPALLYLLLANIWKLLFEKRLGITYTYHTDPRTYDGPYIVVSNHASRVDYVYTGLPFLPHRLNYVAGYNEFFRSHLSFIFKIAQAIPKRNFTPDVHTIKEVKRIINSGGHVCFMPEGMSSISGGNQPCALGGGKLLKNLGVTVYYTKIRGGYLTNTKHCLDERPGRVEVTVDRLFTPEQLKEMTAEEIQDTLNRELYHDDYLWNRDARVAYKGKGEMAKNLGDMLYYCPKCGAEYTMKGEGDVIRCTECGNGATVNEYYDLIPLDESCVIPETIHHWYKLERQRAKERVADPDFAISQKVKLGTLPKYKLLKNQATSIITGEGTLSLSRDGLCYEGTKEGQPFSFRLPTSSVPTYGMCTDITRFYTFYEGEFLEFFPENADTMRWFHLTEELHRANGGKWVDCYEDYE